MFTELGKVLTHPRCTNCHRPVIVHGKATKAGCTKPPVARGADGHGLPAMRCSTLPSEREFRPRP